MKNLKALLIIFTSIISFQIESCPTCVGRISENSPVFFSDEFYQPGVDSMDQLYEQMIQEKQDTPQEEQ